MYAVFSLSSAQVRMTLKNKTTGSAARPYQAFLGGTSVIFALYAHISGILEYAESQDVSMVSGIFGIIALIFPFVVLAIYYVISHEDDVHEEFVKKYLNSKGIRTKDE